MRLAHDPIVLVIVAGLLTSACDTVSRVPWPPKGGGGMAERRPSEDPRIDALQRRLMVLTERNARTYAAADYADAELMLITLRRLSEGGLPEDAEIQMARLKRKLDQIEHALARPKGERAP
jgi:hypothetical protein